ncbi:hypothetical protein HK105_202118 [Polyrhizophydium stewartii]|uniref:Uncharacterized protein n=1 Tax=Polyrhizophydium stewartii TaxID=2732419 RepID=A0ABR4NF98_9FUNG
MPNHEATRLQLERLVLRSLALRAAATGGDAAADPDAAADVAAAAGASGLLRLEAQARHMNEMLQTLPEVAGDKSHADDLAQLRARIELFSDWVEEQKLKRSVGEHQVQAQAQTQTHQHPAQRDGDGVVGGGSGVRGAKDDLRADMLRLPTFRGFVHGARSEGASGSGSASQAEAAGETRPGEMELQDLRRGADNRRMLLGDGPAGGVDGGAPGQSQALAAILERNRRAQDALSDDLALQAQRLKSNTLLFQDKLKADTAVLAATEQQLGDNVLRLQRERRSIKAFSSKSWSTTLLVWGSVIGVVLVFVLVFMFTRVVGPARTHRRAPEPSTTAPRVMSASSIPTPKTPSSHQNAASTGPLASQILASPALPASGSAMLPSATPSAVWHDEL